MRFVEYVGLPSPFADPVIVDKIARHDLSLSDYKAIWKMEQKRQMQGFARFKKKTILILTPEKSREALHIRGFPEGQLSQTYTFGPLTYTVPMTDEDVEILMKMHVAHPKAFRLVDQIVLARS